MADDQSSDFKVVDRRSFTSEGSRRGEDSPAEKSTESRSASAKAEPPRMEIEPESELIGTPDEAGFSEEPTRFETLVSYLSTTAMFQLGLIPGPGGERIPVDMTNADRTIDLLDVLQEKTKGNLTANESRLLDDVLYELRMTFMELQKRQARKA
jgi:hypothetical protein